MLYDRGYIIPSDEQQYLHSDFLFQHFIQQFHGEDILSILDKLQHLYQKKDTTLAPASTSASLPPAATVAPFPGSATTVVSLPPAAPDLVYVYFMGKKSNKFLSKESLQFTMLDFERKKRIPETRDLKHIILISSYKINKNGLAEIDKLRSEDNQIEIFYFNQLSYNVVNHCLVPEHSLTTDEERQTILKSVKSPSFLPEIYINDPPVRWYNWKVGDIIKIRRLEPITNVYVGENWYYRIVVAKKTDPEYEKKKAYQMI